LADPGAANDTGASPAGLSAAGVETADEAELLSEWTVTLAELEQTLVAATELIDIWAGR
jgi:hypothetical protein